MKPKKYAFKHTRKVDLKTKIIHKYPTPTRTLELSHMIVNVDIQKRKTSGF